MYQGRNGNQRTCERNGPAQSARAMSARVSGVYGRERCQQGQPRRTGVIGERPCRRPQPVSSQQRPNQCRNPCPKPPQRKCPSQRPQECQQPQPKCDERGVRFADEMGKTMESCRPITPPRSPQPATYPIMPGSSNVPLRKLPGVSTIILRPGEINPSETTIIDITGLDENDPEDICMPRCPIQLDPEPECPGPNRPRRTSYAPPPSKKALQAAERKSQVCQRTQGYGGRKTEFRDNPLTAEEIDEIEQSKRRAAAWKDDFMMQMDRERRGLGDSDLCDIENEMPPPLQEENCDRLPSPDPWDTPKRSSPDARSPRPFTDFCGSTSTPQCPCQCGNQQRRPPVQRSPDCPAKPPDCPPNIKELLNKLQRCNQAQQCPQKSQKCPQMPQASSQRPQGCPQRNQECPQRTNRSPTRSDKCPQKPPTCPRPRQCSPSPQRCPRPQQSSSTPQRCPGPQQCSPTPQRCPGPQQCSPTPQKCPRTRQSSPSPQRCPKPHQCSPSPQRCPKPQQCSPSSQRCPKPQQCSPTPERCPKPRQCSQSPQRCPQRPQQSPPRSQECPQKCPPRPSCPPKSPPLDPFDPGPCPPQQNSPCLMGKDSPEQDLLGFCQSSGHRQCSPGDLMNWTPAQSPLPFDITCPAEAAAEDILMRSSPDSRLPLPINPQHSNMFKCPQASRTRVFKLKKCPDDPTMAFINSTSESELSILDLDDMYLGEDSNWLLGSPLQRNPAKMSIEVEESMGILQDMDDDLCAPWSKNPGNCGMPCNRPNIDSSQTPSSKFGPPRAGPRQSRNLSEIQRRSRMFQDQLLGTGGDELLNEVECPFTDEFLALDDAIEAERTDLLGLDFNPCSPCQQRQNQSPGPYARELASAIDSPDKYDDLLGLGQPSPERQEQFGPAAQELFNVCAQDASLLDLEETQEQMPCPPQRYPYSRDLYSNVAWNPRNQDQCKQMC